MNPNFDLFLIKRESFHLVQTYTNEPPLSYLPSSHLPCGNLIDMSVWVVLRELYASKEYLNEYLSSDNKLYPELHA